MQLFFCYILICWSIGSTLKNDLIRSQSVIANILNHHTRRTTHWQFGSKNHIMHWHIQAQFCDSSELVRITGGETPSQPLDGCQSPSVITSKCQRSSCTVKACKAHPALGVLMLSLFSFTISLKVNSTPQQANNRTSVLKDSIWNHLNLASPDTHHFESNTWKFTAAWFDV